MNYPKLILQNIPKPNRLNPNRHTPLLRALLSLTHKLLSFTHRLCLTQSQSSAPVCRRCPATAVSISSSVEASRRPEAASLSVVVSAPSISAAASSLVLWFSIIFSCAPSFSISQPQPSVVRRRNNEQIERYQVDLVEQHSGLNSL
nr:uncharacterized protein LOC112779476 isoform X2 [Arachis hypogaea]